MNRKGMDLQQVLIFIVAAVVLTLTLYFGYKAVVSLSQSTEDIQVAKFKQTFETALSRVRSKSTGSVETVSIGLPSKYTEVCILPSTEQVVDLPALASSRPLMHRTWITGNENIVLTPPARIAISTGYIDVPDDIDEDRYCCLDNPGSVRLRLESRPGAVAVGPARPDIDPCLD